MTTTNEMVAWRLPQVRNLAACMGISTDALKGKRNEKATLLSLIAQEQQRIDKERADQAEAARVRLADLRTACVRLGISAEGDVEMLALRLAAHDPTAVSATERRLYVAAGLLFAILGLAALAVSLPHVSTELSRLTGLPMVFAVAFAVIIDGGILASKLLDVLSGKFNLGGLKVGNKVAMACCLVLSAAINWSGVLEVAGNFWLSGLFACFVSGFIFFSFQAAGFLLTRCDKVKDKPLAELVPAPDRMRQRAAELERLQGIAETL